MVSGIIMMSRTSIIIILTCIVAGLLGAGCTQQQTPVAVQTTVPTVTTSVATTPAIASAGMANPASVNCGNIGGTTEIKTAADGSQYGMCTFPNGTSCEEWALFRNEGCMTNATASNVTASNATMQATITATAASGTNATAVNASA
jgi:putative hemolysin